MADEKPQAASLVNDELEVGYDSNFEAQWQKVEYASRIIMALVVLAALLGLLGQGPLSHRTARSGDGALAIDFEPIARYGTATQITVHLFFDDPAVPGSLPAPSLTLLRIDQQLVEPMGLQHIFPQPERERPLGSEIEYSFGILPGHNSGLVRFVVKPNAVGPIHLQAQQGDRMVSWTQWVLP